MHPLVEVHLEEEVKLELQRVEEWVRPQEEEVLLQLDVVEPLLEAVVELLPKVHNQQRL